VSRRDESSVHDPSERYYWLQSPVCLERWEGAREEAPPFHLLAALACKVGQALSRIFGLRPR
jgi:hypothetical protein